MKHNGFLLLSMAALLAAPGMLPADNKEASAGRLSEPEQETFLRTAKIIKSSNTRKGITNTTRVTMSDGKVTHDAHVQCIDEAKHEYRTDRGTELNFKDTYKFNIAAYRLSRLLGIENVPVTVERKVGGKTCSVDWWVEDVLMDEAARKQKKIEAPNPDAWNEQIYVMRIFDQLIFNVDRNLTNLLILKSWDIEMIDHSRSFRLSHNLENVKNLAKCDKTLLANLRALEKDAVQKQLGAYCTRAEIDAVMARRDVIAKYYEQQVKEKGETAVLYDSQRVKPMGAKP